MNELYNQYKSTWKRGLECFNSGNKEEAKRLLTESVNILNILLAQITDPTSIGYLNHMKQTIENFIAEEIYSNGHKSSAQNREISSEYKTNSNYNVTPVNNQYKMSELLTKEERLKIDECLDAYYMFPYIFDKLYRYYETIEYCIRNKIKSSEIGQVASVSNFAGCVSLLKARSRKASDPDCKKALDKMSLYLLWCGMSAHKEKKANHDEAFQDLRTGLECIVRAYMQKKYFDIGMEAYKTGNLEKAKFLMACSVVHANYIVDNTRDEQDREEYDKISREIKQFVLDKLSLKDEKEIKDLGEWACNYVEDHWNAKLDEFGRRRDAVINRLKLAQQQAQAYQYCA